MFGSKDSSCSTALVERERHTWTRPPELGSVTSDVNAAAAFSGIAALLLRVAKLNL